MQETKNSTSRGPGRPAGARSQEGREALLVAARALMAEKGLPGVTLREVAERAGVQPALVSYYFGGKDGLFRAVIDLVSEESQQLITQAVVREGSVEERLRAVIEGWVIAMASDPYAPRLMTERVVFGGGEVLDEFVAKFAKPSLELLRSLLEEGRKRGEFRDIDPMYVIPALVGMCVHFFIAAPMFKRLFDLDEMAPDHIRAFALCVGDVMMRGIAAGKP